MKIKIKRYDVNVVYLYYTLIIIHTPSKLIIAISHFRMRMNE